MKPAIRARHRKTLFGVLIASVVACVAVFGLGLHDELAPIVGLLTYLPFADV